MRDNAVVLHEVGKPIEIETVNLDRPTAARSSFVIPTPECGSSTCILRALKVQACNEIDDTGNGRSDVVGVCATVGPTLCGDANGWRAAKDR